MKKFLIISASLVLLVGCTSEPKESSKIQENVIIESQKDITSTESIVVESHNDYKLISLDKIKNKDGSISVHLTFDTLSE